MKKVVKNIIVILLCVCVIGIGVYSFIGKDRIAVETNVIKYECKYKKTVNIEDLENLVYYLTYSLDKEKMNKYYKILIDTNVTNETFENSKLIGLFQPNNIACSKDFLIASYLGNLLSQKQFDRYLSEFKLYYSSISNADARMNFFSGLNQIYMIDSDVNVHDTYIEGYRQLSLESEDNIIKEECNTVLEAIKDVMNNTDDGSAS